MPTSPRPARAAFLPLLLAGLTALAACDTSNPGGNLDLVAGTYAVAELSFDPNTTDLSTANVERDLDPIGTRLTIFGDDDLSLFVVQRRGASTQRIDLRTRASRERITFEAVTREDEEDLADLLLPSTFSLSYTGDNPNTLEGSISRSNVNLEAFDPERYEDQRSNSGRLSIRFERAGL